jgi:hypothetical protein
MLNAVKIVTCIILWFPPPYIFLTGRNKGNEALIIWACYNTEFISGGCVLTQFSLKYCTVGSAWRVCNISYSGHFWKQIINSLLKSAVSGKFDSLVKLRTTQRVHFPIQVFSSWPSCSKLLRRPPSILSVEYRRSFRVELETGRLVPRSECVDLCVQLSPSIKNMPY